MMLNKLAERLRAVAANVSVAKPAKPDPMREVDAVLAQEPPAKVSGQTPDKLPPVTHPVMRTSAKGLALIKSFESCAAPIGGGRFQAYADPAPGNNGLPVTIGWGSTRDFQGRPIKLGTVWTQEQCDRKKAEDMADFERQVRAILGNAPTTQGQFDALVSWSYNLGSARLAGSTLMRKHKSGDFLGAADEFLKWNRAGGKTMRGLTRRREAERALYLSGTKGA